MLLRRCFTWMAVVSTLLAVLTMALVFRGWLVSDVIKTYHWNPADRRYSELHVISQGGLLSLHHSGTTLDAGEDTTIAQRRGGPKGHTTWYYRQGASANNASPWVHFHSTRGSAHAGVANPNGTSDNWTFELRPLPATAFFLALPAGLTIVRLRAARRRRQTIAAGHCAGCGYDLRASPDRCPECGAVPAGTTLPTPSSPI